MYVAVNQLFTSYIHIYMRTRPRIHARARVNRPLFRNRVFRKWAGVNLPSMDRGCPGFSWKRVDRGRFGSNGDIFPERRCGQGSAAPPVFLFPPGLIVTNGHKKAPGVITWGYRHYTREKRTLRSLTLTLLTAITSSVFVSTVSK